MSNLESFLVGVACGWVIGTGGMWAYFHFMQLIRNEAEYNNRDHHGS